jgi:hypothetical protein
MLASVGQLVNTASELPVLRLTNNSVVGEGQQNSSAYSISFLCPILTAKSLVERSSYIHKCFRGLNNSSPRGKSETSVLPSPTYWPFGET